MHGKLKLQEQLWSKRDCVGKSNGLCSSESSHSHSVL